MHRFFVAPESIREDRVVLRGPTVHQIRDVLRMHPGEEIMLLDNSGATYRAELVMVERDIVRGRVIERSQLHSEPATKITLYQGLLKGQKFDWVLQKGTELGITAFVPVFCHRSVVGSAQDIGHTRTERWERIIAEAAEQAGRAVLPRLSPALLFADACRSAAEGRLSVIPWENEHSTGLRQALADHPNLPSINLLIGPEGGFAEEEIELARAAGIIPVSLGPRILRAETAGLVAGAAILYQAGDLG